MSAAKSGGGTADPGGLSSSEIAARLRQAGEMLRLRGESPYRAGAYEMGADVVEASAEALPALITSDRLTELRGIGPSLARTIAELARTGRSDVLDEIMGELPRGLLAVACVPGLTLRRLQNLHEALGIESLADLEAALAAGAVETVRRGTESDILKDGQLDFPDDVLGALDVVIASVHERHKLDRDAMTARIVRAIEHPCFKIWGHALGRLLLRRDPIECDVERILDTVAHARAAIEVNSSPWRLDLPPEWIRSARRRGTKFVISVDAHSTGELGYLRFGVGPRGAGACGAPTSSTRCRPEPSPTPSAPERRPRTDSSLTTALIR